MPSPQKEDRRLENREEISRWPVIYRRVADTVKTPTDQTSSIDLFRQGWCELRKHSLKSYEKAVVCFLELIARAPEFVPAHSCLAETYAYWGFRLEVVGKECQSYYNLAYEQAEIALSLAPDAAAAHRAMAVALRRGELADPERRKSEILIALDVDSGDPENWLEHWRIFGYQLDSPDIDKVFKGDPNLVAAHIDIGAALCQAERLDESLRHFVSALRLSPDNTLVKYNLAMVLDRMGDTHRARSTLAAAAAQEPDDTLLAEAAAALNERNPSS